MLSLKVRHIYYFPFIFFSSSEKTKPKKMSS